MWRVSSESGLPHETRFQKPLISTLHCGTAADCSRLASCMILAMTSRRQSGCFEVS